MQDDDLRLNAGGLNQRFLSARGRCSMTFNRLLKLLSEDSSFLQDTTRPVDIVT